MIRGHRITSSQAMFISKIYINSKIFRATVTRTLLSRIVLMLMIRKRRQALEISEADSYFSLMSSDHTSMLSDVSWVQVSLTYDSLVWLSADSFSHSSFLMRHSATSYQLFNCKVNCAKSTFTISKLWLDGAGKIPPPWITIKSPVEVGMYLPDNQFYIS